MASTLNVPANIFFGVSFIIPLGYKASVTVSGTWSYSPGRSCGASGNGIFLPNMPNAGAPQGCLLWLVETLGGASAPQDVRGWFTGDNQTIIWGGTTPGDGRYRFSCNDDNLSDNSGQLTLTYDIQPR